MLDGFARSITYLRISITDRCNYRCRYCMPDGGIEKCAHEDICSLEGLRDMAAAAVRCGVKKDPRHRWRAARAPRCGGLLPHAIKHCGC